MNAEKAAPVDIVKPEDMDHLVPMEDALSFLPMPRSDIFRSERGFVNLHWQTAAKLYLEKRQLSGFPMLCLPYRNHVHQLMKAMQPFADEGGSIMRVRLEDLAQHSVAAAHFQQFPCNGIMLQCEHVLGPKEQELLAEAAEAAIFAARRIIWEAANADFAAAVLIEAMLQGAGSSCGKIILASSPSYCMDVQSHWDGRGAPLLGLSPCIDGDATQIFTIDWDHHKIRQGDRCISVVDNLALAFTKLEMRPCGESQQFIHDVCENDEHAVPTNRKGSFLVVGDWGWDSMVHGNVPKSACQQQIGMLMTQKMEELGDVKFVINVGDSFYPDGLTSKDDPRWKKQWRDRYPDRLRSIPWYSVYGNHDTHHDPGMCNPNEGSQISWNLHDYWTFYMPNYNWHIDHPELDLEVVALDLNKFMDGWNKSRTVKELELSDCQYSKCPRKCKHNAELRADGAFDLMTKRLNSSQRSNLVVFSHYPSDPLAAMAANVKLHGKLRMMSNRKTTV
eukprot:Skav235879  [mRNA]  locus=scaffold1192:82466:95325:- [translate_table: standard]